MKLVHINNKTLKVSIYDLNLGEGTIEEKLAAFNELLTENSISFQLDGNNIPEYTYSHQHGWVRF